MSRIPESVEMNNKSLDLGLAVEGLNMAAGATIWGNWIDNLEWVRNLATLSQSDQQYDLLLNRRDKSGTADFGSTLASSQATTTGTNWRSLTFNPQNSSSGGGIIGYSARFGIKNSAAVANTFARLRLQLLGL